MAAFGNVESHQIPGGVGIIPVPSGDPRQIEQLHRQMQEERMSVPDELEAITELSDATKVYVYSVGAWPQVVSLASLGTHTIPGIPEENVLKPGDLTVSKPLVVNGIPSETYPVDDGGRRIYHRPQKHDPLRKHTGMHLALEIIGAGAKSKADNDLRPWGCFVSAIPEQKRPDADAPPSAQRMFAQWKKTVEDAKDALKLNYSQRLAKAKEAHRNGVYLKHYEGDQRLPVMTRVMGVTKADYPFMESMVAPVTKQCINCREHLDPDALSCKCGQRQVSDKKYEEEIARRIKAASGEPETPARKRGRPAASAATTEPSTEDSGAAADEDEENP